MSKLDDLKVYVTDSGVKVALEPVSHVQLMDIGTVVRKEFEARGEPVAPPTYTVELAGGGTETYEYDAESLEYPLELALQRTDGDKDAAELLAARETKAAFQAWAAHQKALLALKQETMKRSTEFLLRKGIKSWDGTKEIPQEWIDECVADGFPVPDDERELYMYYVTRAVLVTPQDQAQVAARIMQLTTHGVDNDLIQGALEFFRHPLEGRNPAGGPSKAEEGRILDDEQAGG